MANSLLLLVGTLSLFLAPSAAIMLEYDVFDVVYMDYQKNISLRLSFDETTAEEENWPEDQVVVLTFDLQDKVSWAVGVMNDSLVFDYNQIRRRRPINLLIDGTILGVNLMDVMGHLGKAGDPNLLSNLDEIPVKAKDFVEEYVYEDEDDDSAENNEGSMDYESVAAHYALSYTERTILRTIQVKVVLESQTLIDLFTLVMTLMIVVNTVNMGGQLDIDVIKAVFKKPIGPIVGFVSQFLLMPLFSFACGWALSDDMLFRLGLFVLGCCPGGTASNFWCILLHGDLNLSITMTFVSTVAALAMMPIWVYMMGPLFSSGNLVIPFDQLVLTLIMLVAPISLGMWIRYRWEKATKFMDKVIVPFTLMTIIFIFTVGVYINWYVFRLITGKMVLAGFLVTGAGYAFGGVLAWLCRLDKAQIIAVSIETAFQNGAIAFIVLKVSMPPPWGEMATVAPVAQIVITALPLWALLAVWKFYEKCIRDKKRAAKAEKLALEEESALTAKEKEAELYNPVNGGAALETTNI